MTESLLAYCAQMLGESLFLHIKKYEVIDYLKRMKTFFNKEIQRKGFKNTQKSITLLNRISFPSLKRKF